MKIQPSSDNSSFYVLCFKSSNPKQIRIWSYSPSAPTIAPCQDISDLRYPPSISIMVSEGDFIVARAGVASPYDMLFKRFTFGSTAAVWADTIACPSGTWDASSSEAMLSADSSYFYALYTFGVLPNYYAFFMTFNTSNGAIIGSRYQSNLPCNSAHFVTCSGYLVMTMNCNSVLRISLYSVSTQTFSRYYEKTTSGGEFNSIIRDPYAER